MSQLQSATPSFDRTTGDSGNGRVPKSSRAAKTTSSIPHHGKTGKSILDLGLDIWSPLITLGSVFSGAFGPYMTVSLSQVA